MKFPRAIIATTSLLPGIAVAQSTLPEQEITHEVARSHWSRVLGRFVDEMGRIDFRGLSEYREDLDRFVEYLGRVSPATQPDRFREEAQVIAYHINAYNALAMHSVLEAGIPEGFNTFLKRLLFFRLRKVVIGGMTTSLYEYENEIIRPLDEPRVHFVLNCMVRSCPRLPQKPFLADKLDSQLEAATREFFSKSKHIRVETETREVWLSEILNFYTKDFVADGRRQSLIGYVKQYAPIPIDESYEVRFIPYDWTINQQPSGTVVQE